MTPARQQDGAALPAIVPVFPLSGVLLLPRGELPLHIFEPRYRAMTAAALEGDGMIAMAQPSGEPASDPDNPPLFRVACLGRIAEARQTEDGRYYITLNGVSRLRMGEELPLRDGYRRVAADYGEFAGDLVEDRATVLDRQRLLDALKHYLGAKGMAADWRSVDAVRNEPLVNALSMLCPFAPGEKQALLEAPDLAERGRLLTALLEMGAVAAGIPAGSGGQARH